MHVLAVRDDGNGQLVLQVTGGGEVRLGDTSNLALKLAVAAAILPRAKDALYVDVSVPTRAVAGFQNGSTPSSSYGAESQVYRQGSDFDRPTSRSFRLTGKSGVPTLAVDFTHRGNNAPVKVQVPSVDTSRRGRS